jgi:hypothetical protein
MTGYLSVLGLSLVAIMNLFSTSEAFSPNKHLHSRSCLCAKKKGSAKKQISISGKGFADAATAKTYESDSLANDVVDVEQAMQEFFDTRSDWLPLFRAMSEGRPTKTGNVCAAQSYLETTTSLRHQDFDEESAPWSRRQAIPENEADKEYLGTFLDVMHQSLLAIPVTMSENGEEDDNDLHFLEEGRRMLAVSRFHVITPQAATDRLERYEQLFATCWSELMQLRVQDEEHTGSLILFPETELDDVKRFCDMNIHQPMQWLGLDDADYEVASMERGSAAIRLLYKLDDIPDIPEDKSAYN